MPRDVNHRKVGLSRALSKLGYCSRSQAAELIRAGRVRLNGAARRDPETPVRLGQDQIDVDDRPVRPEKKIYLMLNKPRGVVTTASDEKGRKTVYHLLNSAFGNDFPWVAPIGRLDKASEGLLLLSNDSEWAGRIADPKTHLDKTYHVQVDALPSEELLSNMRRGVSTAPSGLLRAKQVRVLRKGQRNTWLEVVLDEGRNRQIRRMLEPFGVAVLRLVRIAVGPLQLGDLPKGESRALTGEEKRCLDEAMMTAARKHTQHP